MKLRRFLAVTLCAGALSACSSVKEELKPVKLEPLKPRYLMVERWSRPTGGEQDARYARLQPALANGVLYTVGVEGSLAAWDPVTGKRLWRSKLKASVGSGVGLTGDTGFVGTLDGRVIAFDLANGRQKWEARASSEVLAAPQSNGEVVISLAIDGRVFAFDIKDGRQLWNYDHPVPVLSLRSNATPLISGNSALIAFDNGQILNFDCATGQLRWSARVGQPQGKTELERLVDVDAAPLEFGPYVYGAGYNSRLAAIAKGTGRVAWGQDVSTAQNIAAADNKILVSDANSHVKAFDALTGSLLWENSQLHRRGIGAPTVFGDLVVVVDQQGYMHGLSLADGTLVARTRVGEEPVFIQPLVLEDTLYVLDTDGLLTAYTSQALGEDATMWDMPSNRFKGPISTKPTGLR